MHIVWYTAMSMDGRVAAAGDDLTFLQHIDTGPDGEGEWEEFMAGIDATIVGATTMRWLFETENIDLPVTGKAVWVLTRDENVAARMTNAATEETPVHVVAGDIAGVVSQIEASGCKRLWVCGGGVVAGQLLQIDRIDEVIATMAPVALGSGPALFEATELPLLPFDLVECKQMGSSARLRFTRKR